MPYPKHLQSTIELFSSWPEREDRIEALISLACQYRQVPADIAVRPFEEDRRVPGCESEVFVWALLENGKLRIEFAVENPQGISAQALAFVLKKGLDGEDPWSLENLDDEVVFLLFGRELSMGKSLGLTNMVRSVRARALALR